MIDPLLEQKISEKLGETDESIEGLHDKDFWKTLSPIEMVYLLSSMEVSEHVENRVLNLRTILYWMMLGGTEEEIAGSFLVSRRSLREFLKKYTGRPFDELVKLAKGKGNLQLRQLQWEHAQKNPQMAMWLGRQWLKQSDNPEQQNDEATRIREKLYELKGRERSSSESEAD